MKKNFLLNQQKYFFTPLYVSIRLFPYQAFGLIEVSIVLVILGIIAGLGMKGVKLIENARIRALGQQVENICLATHLFKETYHTWPGDLSHLNVKNPGNGNGIIDAAETSNFFRHLQEASITKGLIMEGQDGSSGKVKAKFGGFLQITLSPKLAAEPMLTLGQSPKLAAEPMLTLGQIPNADTASLSHQDAASIDTQLDDGAPNSGMIVASSNSTSLLEQYTASSSATCLIHFKIAP